MSALSTALVPKNGGPHEGATVMSRDTDGYGRLCGNCDKPKTKIALKKCSRCMMISYCSKACQASHWKAHKDHCNMIAARASLLKQAERLNFLTSDLPPGVSLSELDTGLARWIKFHGRTLMAATIHALELPRDINRANTHIVKMLLQCRPDHSDVPGKFFRILEVEVVEIAIAQEYDVTWGLSVNELTKGRAESQRKGQGHITAIGVVCPPLPVQFVPFGSLKDLQHLKIIPNWKAILVEDVEKGKKFTTFGR